MQIMEAEPCVECGAETDEICDWCAGMGNVARPICSAHAYTRTPWGGELHTLCAKHEQRLHEVRAAFLAKYVTEPVRPWDEMRAWDLEPFFDLKRERAGQ